MINQLYRIIITIIIISSFFANCFADHILGGQISFRNIGDDLYIIKLEVYRACFSSGDNFDDPAIITLFKEDSNGQILAYTNNAYNPVIEIIDPLQDDCMYIPYPFCIEKATYEIQKYFTFSSLVQNIYVVYQRCCRNPVYNNFIYPGDVGTTIWAEIKYSDIIYSNSTPNLSSNLFFEVCSGEEFEFSITAEDNEGDELIYELWYPYSGGGPYGTPENPGDPYACDGVQPAPPCPPPYFPIEFINPIYSFDLPLGLGSTLTINESTGIINGIPELLGQFLVGVRIKEYRNGELISVSHQDITIRVDIASQTKNIKYNSLSCFPNPVKNTFTLELPTNTKSYNLSIRNINGKIVKHLEIFNTDKIDIQINNLKGIFFLELKSMDEIYLDKLVAL